MNKREREAWKRQKQEWEERMRRKQYRLLIGTDQVDDALERELDQWNEVKGWCVTHGIIPRFSDQPPCGCSRTDAKDWQVIHFAARLKDGSYVQGCTSSSGIFEDFTKGYHPLRVSRIIGEVTCSNCLSMLRKTAQSFERRIHPVTGEKEWRRKKK
jgi:hypothetical protein